MEDLLDKRKSRAERKRKISIVDGGEITNIQIN